jgi:GTPase SAR1 family protein
MNDNLIGNHELALWGPKASGKTWLIRSLARTFVHLSVKDQDFDYEINDFAHQPVDPSPPALIEGTGDPKDHIWWVRRKPKSSKKNNPAHILSSQVHMVNVHDAKGQDTIDGSNRVVQSGFENSQFIIMLLDPTLTQHAPVTTDDNSLIPDHEYTNYVRIFLQTLLNQPLKRYIAICISKFDMLGIRRPPKQLVKMYFGDEMMDLLQQHQATDRIELNYFAVSAMGFINKNKSNFDISLHDGIGGLAQPGQWKPFQIEQPFFWLFEIIEKQRLQRTTSPLVNIFYKEDRLKKYIPYPTRDVYSL